MHLLSSGFISDPAARSNSNQPGKQALLTANLYDANGYVNSFGPLALTIR